MKLEVVMWTEIRHTQEPSVLSSTQKSVLRHQVHTDRKQKGRCQKLREEGTGEHDYTWCVCVCVCGT